MIARRVMLPFAEYYKDSAKTEVRLVGLSSDSPSRRGAAAGMVKFAAASIVGSRSMYDTKRVLVPEGT